MAEAALQLQPTRLLIVKLSSIGDILHAFPAVSAIRRLYPEAHLAWAVDHRMKDLVAAHPAPDEILVLGSSRSNHHSGAATLWDYFALARRVRQGGFDAVVDMQGLLKSSLITYNTRARWRVGFGNGRIGNRWAVNIRLPEPARPIHAVDHLCLFARLLGAEPDPNAFEVRLAPEDRGFAEGLLGHVRGEPGPLVAIIPGSAWETKRWPEEYFAEVAAALEKEAGARFVIIGGRQDRPAARVIVDRLRNGPVLAAGEATLMQSAALTALCDLAIGGDTGITHIAAALGVPTVAIYGPTDPRVTGPRGPQASAIVREQGCWPCRKRHCDEWECMLCIRPPDVLEAALAALGGSRPDAG
jgi:lipopolysaccharide heptosyltransferase I